MTAARNSVTGTPSGGEDVADLVAGAEVRGQLLVGAEATQVHDPIDAGGTGGRGEVAGGDAVRRFESRTGAHGVDEVVGNVAPVEAFDETGVVEHVGGMDLHVARPRPVGELLGAPRQAYDVVALGEEPGDQSATDVAGCPGDGDAHGRSVRRFVVEGTSWHPCRDDIDRHHERRRPDRSESG